MSVDHYTYRVTWSAEDGEHVGLCAEFPSLSWLARTPEAALKGIRRVVAEAVAENNYSGEFCVWIPPQAALFGALAGSVVSESDIVAPIGDAWDVDR